MLHVWKPHKQPKESEQICFERGVRVDASQSTRTTILSFVLMMEATMQSRTIDDVTDELRDEGHRPMVRFVLELRERPWATELTFDLSMLRLWIARKGVPRVEAMIVYGDGRQGGRPRATDVDAYDLTFFREGGQDDLRALDAATALERIREWLMGVGT
jgi:hypothetical protein